MSKTFIMLALLLWMNVCGNALAQNVEPELPVLDPSASESAETFIISEVPRELIDEPFVEFVDLGLVGRAIQNQDAALLTDVALQLAEGERRLKRPHKNLPASFLLNKAIEVAVETKHTEALDRLALSAKREGNKALAARIAVSRKLAGTARAMDPALVLSVADTSVRQFQAYTQILNALKVAKTTGDATRLDDIEKEMNGSELLSSKQKTYLADQIQSARKSMPKNADAASKALAKLVGQSRDIWGDAVSGARQFGRDLDSSRLDIMTPGPRAGRDYTQLHFRNRTNRPIWVMVVCIPYYPPSNDSELKSMDSSSPWQMKGWYKINPGQTSYIANTNNINLYMFATDGQGHSWGGNSIYRTVHLNNRNRRVGFRHTMIGIGTPRSWTINIR